MERIFRYEITETDTGFPVKRFLRGRGFTGRSLIGIKKDSGSVLVNGEAVFLTRKLAHGDVLEVIVREEFSSESIEPVELPLDIVYEDEDLMVVNKPAGMPIHPSVNNRGNSLGNALAWYFQSRGTPFVFRCINRLDRDTSGLTIIAKHKVSAGILSAMVAAKTDQGILREYRAIVRGHVTPKSGTIDAPLSRKEGSILERQVDFAHGERAVTHYRVADEKNGYSLISLRLETGRTHQIRIHMKYLGYPLIGDYLYNPDMERISRQALHAYRLSFRHPFTGELLTFTAPLPEDMASIL